MNPQLIFVIVLSLGFDFLNGINDSSNIVATMISSRAIPPRAALLLTAVAEFSGPFIFGVAVARTIGDEVVMPGVMTMNMIIAALISAVVWNLITRALGIPSSSSHAMIGGLTGAVVCGAGWDAIKFSGISKVVIVLFTSPLIGFVVGYVITKIIFFFSMSATPSINIVFKRFQLLTAVALALSHGTNDSQKTMGIITLALVTSGVLSKFQVPTWVIISCALMIALGTSIGSWKLIRTLGSKFFKIKPVDAFSAQLSSAAVILSASLIGGPVSTTQVVSSSIMGVGAAERVNKVRWGVAGEIVTAWFLTIPATGLVAAGIYWLMAMVFHI
jgi:inorganic phosphate transporter, PiT family